MPGAVYHVNVPESNAEGDPRKVVTTTLEEIARLGAQRLLAQALEEEVAEFLQRERYERREEGMPVGYRNGYHKPRQIATCAGTIEVRAPRVRDTEEPFTSRILPRWRRSSDQVREMIPELYLHGLATGDFEPALRGILGDAAPLSPSSVVRLKQQWEEEYQQWSQRRLDGTRYVYLWADGIYLKAGLGKEKTALLVVIGVNEKGEKELLAMAEGYRESTESWRDVLRDLKQRGLQDPKLVIGDGSLGLWAAVSEVFPEAKQQHCWCHKMTNVLDKLPRPVQPEAKVLLRDIYSAPTREEAEARIEAFKKEFCDRYPAAVGSLERDKDALLVFYDFPQAHWKSIKTTNPIESIFDSVRLRTRATRRMRSARTGLYLVFQIVKRSQSRWHKLDGADLLTKVANGVKFVNGKEVVPSKERAAAD
jgi:transposase-like protein